MRAALHRWLVLSYVAVAVAGAAWTRFRRARHRRRARRIGDEYDAALSLWWGGYKAGAGR